MTVGARVVGRRLGWPAALRVAWWAEWLKLRRSHLPVLTAASICLAPLLAGVFTVVARTPARGSPAMQGKAVMLGMTPDWPGYLAMLSTVYAAGGLVVSGILTAWVFGREFSDRTALDVLALPVARSATVVAKFAVVMVWSAVLAVVLLSAGSAVGAVLLLPDWSPEVLEQAVGDVGVLYGLGTVLMTPVALAASIGRGYLPAVGVVLVAVVSAQVLVSVGIGGWFPWAVPALAVGLGGPGAGSVGAGGYLLVAGTAAVGAFCTLRWWQRADQS